MQTAHEGGSFEWNYPKGVTGEDINRLKENLSAGTGRAQSLPLIDTKPSQD